MPNIETYLEDIRQATYGREVRSAIANGIQECYEDVTNGVTVADQAASSALLAADEARQAISNLNSSVTTANELIGLVQNALDNVNDISSANTEETLDYVLGTEDEETEEEET